MRRKQPRPRRYGLPSTPPTVRYDMAYIAPDGTVQFHPHGPVPRRNHADADTVRIMPRRLDRELAIARLEQRMYERELAVARHYHAVNAAMHAPPPVRRVEAVIDLTLEAPPTPDISDKRARR